MEFNFKGLDAQMQQMYQTPVKEGLWNGTSLGGDRGVLGILPRSVDSREAIQREIEKEMIREEILAEEIARKRVLEAEVRREMAMEKAIHGGGFPSSSFMLKPPGMPPRGQPYGGGSGSQRREIGSFQAVPFPSSSGDGKKKVIDLGKLNGAKTKPTAAGSSEWSCAVCKVSAPCDQGLNAHLAGKKHQAQMATLKASKAQRQKSDGMIKMKNKFGEIGLGVAPKKPATMEPKVLKSKKPVKSTQPPVNKNSSKCVSKKEEKKSEGKGIRQPFSFFCEICQVEASSDKMMNDHIKGKKHLNNLLKLHQESAASETTHDSKEKHKAETEFVEKIQVEEESESIGSVRDGNCPRPGTRSTRPDRGRGFPAKSGMGTGTGILFFSNRGWGRGRVSHSPPRPVAIIY